jgi:hypothetical protein
MSRPSGMAWSKKKLLESSRTSMGKSVILLVTLAPVEVVLKLMVET